MCLPRSPGIAVIYSVHTVERADSQNCRSHVTSDSVHTIDRADSQNCRSHVTSDSVHAVDRACDVVCIANHSRSISITEYSLCTPKVIIVQKSYSFQHNRSACRTTAHDMLRAQLETCNYHLNPGLSIQSLS